MSAGIKCFWIERTANGRFRRLDTRQVRRHMGSWGPGALFAEPDAPEHVHVLTPDGWADLFRWKRTGNPRKPETFSALPSIETHGPNPWHGFLTNGVLKATT